MVIAKFIVKSAGNSESRDKRISPREINTDSRENDKDTNRLTVKYPVSPSLGSFSGMWGSTNEPWELLQSNWLNLKTVY